MKKLFYWILITISLFAIVRDTNAIPVGSYLSVNLKDGSGTVIATPVQPYNISYQFTTYVEDATDVIFNQIGCVKLTTDTTDGYIFTAGIFPLANGGTAGIDYILSSSGSYRFVNYRLHNDAVTGDNIAAPYAPLFNNQVAIIDFVMPKNINSGGSSPGEGVLCINTLFNYDKGTTNFLLAAINYAYYGFPNGTYLISTTDFIQNPQMITEGVPTTYFLNIHPYYSSSKQSLFSESNSTGSFYKYLRNSQQTDFDIGGYGVVRDFMVETGSTVYMTTPSLPSHFGYTTKDVTYGTGGDNGTGNGDIDTGTYYDDCEGFTDLGCYISGFTQFIFDIPGMIFDKIIDAILSLVPDISFSGTFDSCSADFNSEDSTWTDKLKNFLAFLNPFMPPGDGEIVCTVWGEEELHYSRLIPEQNFFEIYLPNAPAYLTVSPYILPGQTIFDIVLISVMIGIIFYKRHH